MAVTSYKRNGRKAAVLFVKANWCPHCRAMKPEIHKAAAILGSVLDIEEVDSKVHATDIEGMRIDGFPTVFFRDNEGRLTKYTGQRTGNAIADWACHLSGKCPAR